MEKTDRTKTMDRWTSIRLKESTVVRLKDLGRKGESYNGIVDWLLAHRPKKR